MSTLTDIVAAVVMHSSAAALSHFGVAVEPAPAEKAQPAPQQAPQRVIARTPRKAVEKASAECPQGHKVHVTRV